MSDPGRRLPYVSFRLTGTPPFPHERSLWMRSQRDEVLTIRGVNFVNTGDMTSQAGIEAEVWCPADRLAEWKASR